VVSLLKTETLDYFSLDPAAFDDQFLRERLNRREEAEVQIATNPAQAVPYPLQPCINPEDTNTLVPCGSLGDRAGEDDFSGHQLSRAPRWKLTFSGEYAIPLGRFGQLIPRAQYTWTDETYFRVFNRDFDRQEPFHQTDAKLIWRSPEERWEVEAFVENIEDEAPKQNILVGARAFGSPPLAWYGPPRFYGVRAGFRFQ
jgi:outer membrane receptor protein involved in Fe transport